MKRLLLLLAAAVLLLPGAARPAACSPLDCAPSQFVLAHGTPARDASARPVAGSCDRPPDRSDPLEAAGGHRHRRPARPSGRPAPHLVRRRDGLASRQHDAAGTREVLARRNLAGRLAGSACPYANPIDHVRDRGEVAAATGEARRQSLVVRRAARLQALPDQDAEARLPGAFVRPRDEHALGSAAQGSGRVGDDLRLPVRPRFVARSGATCSRSTSGPAAAR